MSSSIMPACNHCGSYVSNDFARVFADQRGRVLACLQCSAQAGIAEIVIPPGSALIGKSALDVWMRKLAFELGIPAYPLSCEDMRQLQIYSWPGNVRELRNVLERTLLLGQLPAELLTFEGQDENHDSEFAIPSGWTLRDVEQRYMLDMLKCVEGNKSEAARRLGVSRKTIERKLNEWHIEPIR